MDSWQTRYELDTARECWAWVQLGTLGGLMLTGSLFLIGGM